MSRFRRPDRIGGWCLTGAASIALGVVAAQAAGWLAVGLAASAVVALGSSRRRPRATLLLFLFALGCGAGQLGVERVTRTLSTEIVDGPIRVVGRLPDDPRRSVRGVWFLIEPSEVMVDGQWRTWEGPTLLVNGNPGDSSMEAGDTVEVLGKATSTSGVARGDAYAGTVAARSTEVVSGPSGLLFGAASRIRHRVADSLAPWDGQSAGGLVAGFLIGDTTGVSAVDEEELRLSGLSHFVAVSGSNVALFLMLWWVVVGPLALGPRRRALAGFVGILLFVVVTRWESSVLRAASMAGIVLMARAVGLPLSAWSALGIGVGALFLAAPEVVFDVGLQLSVAATLGVMAGADLFAGRLPKPVATTLSATVAAQVAVAPILLLRFGTVPLAAPLANLLAAPAVALATMTGSIGVALGWSPLLAVSVGAARWVLAVAEVAAGWPQLGWFGAGGAVGVLILLARPGTRWVGLVASAAAISFSFVNGPVPVDRPSVVFLDIGQGDAILVFGEGGEVMLMDGGPDPVLLVRKLRQFGVDRIDLLVVSHPHEDHVAGLLPVAERYPIGVIWQPGFVDSGTTFARLDRIAADRGIGMVVPALGHHRLGTLSIEVLGPVRRYASPNDQSLVLRVEGDALLLPGDIEAIAQAELGPLPARIMKVPHSGSKTSDLTWLSASGPEVAVISVGPNSFGHPSDSVIDVLHEAGSDVVRTDQAGDVVISLRRSPENPP